MIASPPPAALAVSPARLALAGGASAAVEIRNPGSGRVVVVAGAGGYALDGDGRPRAVARPDGVRLIASPAVVSVAAGGTAQLVVAARVPRGARPGDHAELLVLATRPIAHRGVGIRLRIGVPVVVRVAGAVVHRLVVQSVALRRAALVVAVRNRGNAVERLTPGAFRVRVVQGGRVVARLRAPTRELLPGGRAVLRLRCPRSIRGRVAVVIRIARSRARAWPVRLP